MFNTQDINQYPVMSNSVSIDSNPYDNEALENKVNRATLEQKLAIVLFFNKHKAEMPRFKLVNMLNKKISISISSLSSWLKKENSLKEKYCSISNSSIDCFDFNQIIQDILNSEDSNLVIENSNAPERHGSISLNHININKKDTLRSKYIKINKMMDQLVIERKQNQLPITESVLKSYWVKFYPLCGIEDPKRSKGPSNGWLDNFKNKHELKNYGSDYDFNFEASKSNENKVSKKNIKSVQKFSHTKNTQLPLINTISSERIVQNSPSSKMMYDHNDSIVSHQSGLYITKPLFNKYPDINTNNKNETLIFDDKRMLKPLSMAEKTNPDDHTASRPVTASLNSDPHDTTMNTKSRTMASQTDLLNALKPQQESTDSFFRKFGSGIFNFNNASSKDLENVNAFFQQQKQNQGAFPYDNIKKNDSMSILGWFKNTASQPTQKPLSSGMSFLNLALYKREKTSATLEPESLANKEHTLYNDIGDTNQHYLKTQVIKSEPILTNLEKPRFSKILSGETFNNTLENKDRDGYLSDDSDDSDGGLEINVPKAFSAEEIDSLLKVHVSNFLTKNGGKYGKSLKKFNEFMEVFHSEK